MSAAILRREGLQMKRLTSRQQEILDFIGQSIKERGYPPTIRDIGQSMGIRSTNGVNDHLKALKRKGYLCRDELRTAWPQRSQVPLDSLTASGYSIEASLIRYLNALSLPKDSLGVMILTDEQVEEIGRGVANPIYEHGSTPRKMLYVMFFEYENYRCYRAVEGFSMLQRIELWTVASHIIGCHLWTGVGTGDLGDAMEEDFRLTGSPLQKSELLPHNEYLTLMAMLGIPAFVLLAFFFLRATPRLRHQGLLLVAWTVAILVSCLTENTFDSLAGILFSTWFMAFRHGRN